MGRVVALLMALGLISVGAVFGGACAGDGSGRDGPGSRGAARVGGEVVATVDGEPITVAEVARAVRETGLGPEPALRRLEEQVLLAQEAARRGYDEADGVRRARAKARVQALVARTIEQAVPPERRAETLRALLDELEKRFGVQRHGPAIGSVAEAPLDGLTGFP